MSSTSPGARDTRAADALALALFDEVLAPLGARRQAEGRAAFPAPDPAAATYFTTPERRTPSDAPGTGLESPEAFVAALAERWRASGDRDLAALAPRLAEIARALADAAADDDGDLPPFVYTMF